jgi:hypothetical protein
MSGKQDSEESIKHRWMAVKTVNERLSKQAPASDDSNIASVALLAGLEVFILQIFLRMKVTVDIAHVWMSPELQYTHGRTYDNA